MVRRDPSTFRTSVVTAKVTLSLKERLQAEARFRCIPLSQYVSEVLEQLTSK